MTGAKFKQLNPFELKSAITNLLNKITSIEDLQNCLADFDMLDNQEDKTYISKVLFKELTSAKPEKIAVICFLLERYTQKDELINKLWETLKNKNLETEVKITILNLLRELDSDWSYEMTEEYLDDAAELMDETTKQMLNTAVINPEIQIDFMDFMATIRLQDKITLLNSFSEDFSSDALANILIPVFVSEPNNAAGKEALKLLADTKSQLALHVLEEIQHYATGELLQNVKRSLSTIKISGMREDNTKEFYKKILSNSKPYKFYITYPDGHGDQALIFTRITEDQRIRFVSIVINIFSGIKDCFGFFDISQFECSKILERFLKDEKTVDISPSAFKTILYNAELTTIQTHENNWKLPYEYVCWKNLLVDIDYNHNRIDEILNEQVTAIQPQDSIIKDLSNMKVTAHWFMDYQYSSEFEEVLSELNTSNLDELVENNLEKVFTPDEKSEWTKKLIMSAYMKFAIDKKDEASLILGLAKDENLKQELYKNILKRSIYEYLIAVKYDKSINNYELDSEKIDELIQYIEEKWVENV